MPRQHLFRPRALLGQLADLVGRQLGEVVHEDSLNPQNGCHGSFDVGHFPALLSHHSQTRS